MQQFRLKIFYFYRKIVKKPQWFHSAMTPMTMFTHKVKIYLTLFGFSQYRCYTDFIIKLDGFIWILIGLLTNYKI